MYIISLFYISGPDCDFIESIIKPESGTPIQTMFGALDAVELKMSKFNFWFPILTRNINRFEECYIRISNVELGPALQLLGFVLDEDSNSLEFSEIFAKYGYVERN